ncbi:MAG: hypothetical protein H7328_09690 [Bdellovibrio sp.]|nr:hypothetical protein [Bdellovibrio sp.]
MKTAVMILAATMMTGAMAFAEMEHKDSSDTSKNPITGTKKTVKKHKKMVKGEMGEAETTSKETTKEYKDGGMKKTTETKTTSETKH